MVGGREVGAHKSGGEGGSWPLQHAPIVKALFLVPFAVGWGGRLIEVGVVDKGPHPPSLTPAPYVQRIRPDHVVPPPQPHNRPLWSKRTNCWEECGTFAAVWPCCGRPGEGAQRRQGLGYGVLVQPPTSPWMTSLACLRLPDLAALGWLPRPTLRS